MKTSTPNTATVHAETLKNGVKIEVVRILDGRRFEIHSNGAYRGAPMQLAFRGSREEARSEYRRIKASERLY